MVRMCRRSTRLGVSRVTVGPAVRARRAGGRREPRPAGWCKKGAGEPWEGRPTEESELIERAQRGDAMAYEELVRRHQDAALRVAGLVLAGGAEVEDAVQDAFVKAYRVARAASGRVAVPALDPADRRQRGAQSATLGRPAGGARPATR